MGMSEKKREILEDLRSRFGAGRTTLDAAELAEILGSTAKAVYSMKGRSSLPVPVLSSAGKLLVSIYDVAAWLAGEAQASQASEAAPWAAPAVDGPANATVAPPPRRRRRESMGAYLTTLRDQMNFLGDLSSEIERLELIDDASEAAEKDV